MNTQKQSTEQTPAIDAEVMMVCFERDMLGRYRYLIFVGPAAAPDQATKVQMGTWSNSLRAAQGKGLRAYFSLYEETYGFKHPEDPSRTGREGPLPRTVVSYREGDHYQNTATFREADEVSHVAR